ncbi:MAG TPA: hypothetical protein VJU59_28240 [Paraburkholderia sp.]|uniref:hypothetical protein n=1 Tax=Paraburkholderia sp. TaxID=1926495 RepID=UPI002B4623BF|nr:hypothetical protein [Paraburkholderia sp.]HKR43525.1 hypothetical protein [Paraburkholderia sp.]
MLLLEQLFDPSRGVVHISGLTANSREAARFTTDAKRESIVGTINAASSVYRLIPVGKFYELYRLPTNERYERISAGCAAAAGAVELETFHTQMLALADLQPARVRQIQQEHTLLLQGDSLGNMPAGNSVEDIKTVLARLTPLIPSLRSLSLNVTQVLDTGNSNNPARAIRFNQLVAGLPVDRRNEIRVDARGLITEMNLSLVPADIETKPLVIDKKEAIRRAQAQLNLATASSQRNAEILSLDLVCAFADGRLVPEYRIVAKAPNGEDYFLHINGNSGDVNIVSATIH